MSILSQRQKIYTELNHTTGNINILHGSMYLGSAPEFKVSGGDNEQRAIDDFEVHNLLCRGTQSLLQRDDLRPPICHIHLLLLLIRFAFCLVQSVTDLESAERCEGLQNRDHEHFLRTLNVSALIQDLDLDLGTTTKFNYRATPLLPPLSQSIFVF